MTEYEQKFKETIDEQSLEIMQADVVIRRLVSALKYISMRCPFQTREEEAIVRIAIRGGESHLGYEVSADELIENYRKIER
jgi:hypothetical protein